MHIVHLLGDKVSNNGVPFDHIAIMDMDVSIDVLVDMYQRHQSIHPFNFNFRKNESVL